MTRAKLLCGLLLAFGLCGMGRAQATVPRVEVVADLLEMFKPGMAVDTTSTELRRPASADAVKENALFEHPLSPGKPARVTYELELPKVATGDWLILAFDIAISDGVQPGKGMDGVGFEVLVDGSRKFREETAETIWKSRAVRLEAFAGKRVRLTLLVDALRNTAYDWAVWGNPRILHFRGGGAFEAGGVSPMKVGSIAIQRTKVGGKIRIAPLGKGTGVDYVLSAAEAEGEWVCFDFAFPAADGIRMTSEPAGLLAGGSARIGSYPAQLTILRVNARQALSVVGRPVPLAVEVKNVGRGVLEAGRETVSLKVGARSLESKPLPTIPPGEKAVVEWSWDAKAKPGAIELRAEAKGEVSAAMTGLLELVPEVAAWNYLLENEHVRAEFVSVSSGVAFARLLARIKGEWTQVAIWKPLGKVVSDDAKGKPVSWMLPLTKITQSKLANGGQRLALSGRQKDRDGVLWELEVTVSLGRDSDSIAVEQRWKTGKERLVRHLGGPNIYVGEGTTGTAKSWGLLPGLEYLVGGEQSSNPRDFAPPLDDRRSPVPWKVTVPLMAVTVGPGSESAPEMAGRFYTPDSLKDSGRGIKPNAAPAEDITVSLSWDPMQAWLGTNVLPAIRFSSPNLDEGMQNHRLGLFLPGVPAYTAENSEIAERPLQMKPGEPVLLKSEIAITRGTVLSSVKSWLDARGGLPKPNVAPRSFQEELDLCRKALLKTVWVEGAQKWVHFIGSGPAHAPGFATLLWLDSQVAEKAEDRAASKARVELAAGNMMRESGPGILISQANCHILQWEFPFYYGHLQEAMDALEGQVTGIARSQTEAGGWLYAPGSAQQSDLGAEGDSVLGTCANHAATLLRHARLTGNATSRAAGLKALEFMRRFKVPRGGQTWECPMYEPDILAAAYAIRAYHDGYRITGDVKWLEQAVYWAETGVPFNYYWSLPQKPMMLGASIPVFGSTFYTHTWLAVPVQWCGLVYAWDVFHLAEELEKRPVKGELGFKPEDWKRLVGLLTVSGMYQQCTDEKRLGTYPDSIGNFENRNPVFINPEDLMVNVLALNGIDPDIKTAIISFGGTDLTLTSAAKILNLSAERNGIATRLHFYAGEISHSFMKLSNAPKSVTVDGTPVAHSTKPLGREAGWFYDAAHQRIYLSVPHSASTATVRINLD